MDPVEIVNKTEAAYQAEDVDRIMELFDPEIVFYWNGRKQGEGLAELRELHEDEFVLGDEPIREYEIRKSLRAASGDTIAVEWTNTWIDEDGNHNEEFGGEFWTMRDERVREWHAYAESYEFDETDDQQDEDYLSHPLNPPSTEQESLDPEDSVRKAEAAYDAADIDWIMELLDPEIVIYWNGRKRAEGIAEARSFHEGMFAEEMEEFEVRKSLRAASGDTITVEWSAAWDESDGTRGEQYGGEFWTMRDGRLREWHAYANNYELDDADGHREESYLSHPPLGEVSKD